MTERYISGQPEGWSETDQGHRTIYTMDPNLIPASQMARVIYELRLDIERLNSEVIQAQLSPDAIYSRSWPRVQQAQAQSQGYDYAPIYAALSAWDTEDQPTGEQIDAIIAAYQDQQAQPQPNHSIDRLLTEAAGLLSEDGANAEYDRAIVELVTRLVPGANHDDHDTVLALIKGSVERTWTFTISANFTAATKQEAWDEWVDWLTNPGNLEDGTQVTENLPDEYDIVYSTEGFSDCRECGKFGYHTRKAGCIIATERAAAVNGAGTEDEYDDGTPSVHLRQTPVNADGSTNWPAFAQMLIDIGAAPADGTEGQDRESYTDDQDRDSYTVTETCANCGVAIHDDGSGAWFDGAGLDFCEDGNPHTPSYEVGDECYGCTDPTAHDG